MVTRPRKFRDFSEQRRISEHEQHMALAIKEAEKAQLDGDLAVGAVLVWNDRVISDSNTAYSEGDATNHAEMNVIKKASQILHRPLHDAVLYVTLEPCLMCAMAARLHGIQEVVFGCYDDMYGFVSSKLLADHTALNIAYRGGILGKECLELMPKNLREHLRVE